MEENTFGPHRNDLMERIAHRHNVRRELIMALPVDDAGKFLKHTLKETNKFAKTKKIK